MAKLLKIFLKCWAVILVYVVIENKVSAQNITLINANVANQYIVTSMPMALSPGCPLIGYLRFFPGGNLSGMFIIDMARSKSAPFTGTYTLTGGKKISFNSNSPQVPLSNLNGTIERAVTIDKKRPPIEYLILTTNTTQCAGQKYKLTLTDDEE